jgi:hypothetical protein
MPIAVRQTLRRLSRGAWCLLAAILIVASLLGFVLIRRNQEEAVIRSLQDMGAHIEFASPRVSLLFSWLLNGQQMQVSRHVSGVHWPDERGTDNRLAELSQLEGLPDLVQVRVTSGEVTDTGVACLKAMKTLKFLDLGGNRVTDSGLAHLGGLLELEGLDLHGTRVTDAGLRHLSRLIRLSQLSIADANITDAGLEALKALPNLRSLDLAGTQITDAGLMHLQGLTQMQVLVLSNTQVTDAGLLHLKGFPNLRRLDLRGTQVTDAGIADLQSALPELIIKR